MVAERVLAIFGCFRPTGNPVAMLVAIFWLRKSKPILDFLQRAGRFHISSEGQAYADFALSRLWRHANITFCSHSSHELGAFGFLLGMRIVNVAMIF